MNAERKLLRAKIPGRLALAVLLFLFSALPASADDARKLLVESEGRHRTKSQEYAGELVVTNKDGKARRKGWRSYRQGYAGDARILVRFTDPPEVRGVGFLSLSRQGAGDDQWLYLPSMKRERRIAPQDRDASFVGTDFNYEDMEEFDHAKYDVSLLGDRIVDGQPCHMIEARPRGLAGRSVYERKVLFLRKDDLYLARVDLFRIGGGPGKALTFSDIVAVDGHTVARRLEMIDVVKKSRTTLTLTGIAFDRPQPADRFTLKNLNREEGE